MAIPIVIYGKTGSGKSRSLKFFAPDEILLINVEQKPLPFRGGFTHTINTGDVEVMKKEMYAAAQAGCRTVVIDDAGLVMTQLFMKGHRNKQGSSQFDLYNDIADVMYYLIQFIKIYLPPDMIVYLMLHEDTNDYGTTKIKTIGKLLDDKASIPEQVTVCIRCMTKDKKHVFRTETDGTDITKTPEDMFPEPEFENNLKYVDTKIREYYGFIKGGNEQ